MTRDSIGRLGVAKLGYFGDERLVWNRSSQRFEASREKRFVQPGLQRVTGQAAGVFQACGMRAEVCRAMLSTTNTQGMRGSDDGTLRLSPTDLANHLACAHLTQLELRVQRGELERPHVVDPYGQIIMRKGNEHEAAHLARLEADGLRVLRLKTYDDEDFDADEARRATEEAVRSAEADVIYQAYLTDGTWRGFADFLVRLPDGTYEPVDTKLARSAKPLHAIQLCFYAEQLERIQGRLPEHVHVELGSGERATLRTAEFIAFFRRSRKRLLAAIEGEASLAPTARPRPHRRGRGPSTTARSATSATSAATSASRRTTRSSSRGSGGCTRSGSPPQGSRR